MFLSLQDALIRYNTLIGKDTLWIPGTDHAGLATHDKILAAFETENKTSYTKKEYLAKAWNWTQTHQGIILNQFSKLGIACDWEREHFTLDSAFQKTCRYAFEELCKAGKISKTEKSYFLDFKPEAKKLAENIRNKTIDIQPIEHANRLLHMLDHMTLWDIGRDIPWGIEIPTYESSESFRFAAGTSLEGETPSSLTLDTWFTSSLWPLATLNWPENKALYERYYPAQIMETGYDILFFWAARTLMMCEFLTGQYPFHTILLHGLLRDKNNQKFSKALGNGIDPLDLLEDYGADAIRLYCAAGIDIGKDSKFNPALLASYRRELQKIYSAARLLILKKEELFSYEAIEIDYTYLEPTDLKIEAQLYTYMSNYQIKEAIEYLLTEFRESFCNEYLQTTKGSWSDRQEFTKAYTKLYYRLLWLQPFIPHLSEALLNNLQE